MTWAQMALSSLVPFQGPKKSQFSGFTPRNDAAPLETITYRAIKTGTLIVIGLICDDLSRYASVLKE